MRLAAIALVVLILPIGCLRLGSGDDLHFVCEEKSASPRKAYGIDFLVAQTRADDGVPPEFKVAILEAARAHVVTPSGREHAGFDARLATINESTWRFEAAGVYHKRPPDLYDVVLRAQGESIIASAPPPGPGPVAAPRTLVDIARNAANATSSFDARNATVAWATWDPEAPSCVRLRLDAHDVFVNVVQERVVLVRSIDDV